MYTLGFIGAGHIATALMDGLLAGGAVRAGSICAYDTNSAVRAALAEKGLPLQMKRGKITVYLHEDN